LHTFIPVFSSKIKQDLKKTNNDSLAKSSKPPFAVIPAEAGIQGFQEILDPGACPGPDPGFAGVTALKTFYEPINNAILPKECYNPLNHETRRLTGHDQAR
jgi:hypothetical protein